MAANLTNKWTIEAKEPAPLLSKSWFADYLFSPGMRSFKEVIQLTLSFRYFSLSRQN